MRFAAATFTLALACGGAASAYAYDPMPDPRMANGPPAVGAAETYGGASFLEMQSLGNNVRRDRYAGQAPFGTSERKRISGSGGYRGRLNGGDW